MPSSRARSVLGSAGASYALLSADCHHLGFASLPDQTPRTAYCFAGSIVVASVSGETYPWQAARRRRDPRVSTCGATS
jgi:hypothetical protein